MGRKAEPMKQNAISILLLGVMLFSVVTTNSQQLPFQNPDLSPEERARDLISRLTLEEKALLLCDQSPAIPRLGIKEFNWWSEALHGVASAQGVTVFPMPIAMAASFNEELVYQIFDAVSDEFRALYHDWIRKGNKNKRFLSLSVWTPHINIFRDPRWGRGQETFGEDPYLTARMGVQVVNGLQGPRSAKYRKLLACAKHFAVHSGPEWSRHVLNVNHVDLRDLYETYLPAFKALVQEADVRQVMCAYQRLDDDPCCGNARLLGRILREEWGFRHLVVSDCGAVTDFHLSHKVSSTPIHAAAKAILAGTDIECAWEGHYFARLPEAVRRGLVKEEDLNRSLMRVLVNRIELGDFDDDSLVPWAQIPMSVVNCEKHRALAYEMARQSIVLLQNRGNILPLSKSINKIAVLGPNADDAGVLWGTYNGVPVRTITILEGIKSKLPSAQIFYDKACDLVLDKDLESYINRITFENRPGFKLTCWNNRKREGDPAAIIWITNAINLSVHDGRGFAPGVNPTNFSAILEGEFVPQQEEELAFWFGVTGSFELFINGQKIRGFEHWRILPNRATFKFEPGKKYKIEIRFTQLYDWRAQLQLDFGKEVDQDYTKLLQKLRDIDLVVFVGGLSGRVEAEEMPVELPGFKGGDRTCIELPKPQRRLLKALKEAGKKIVFVVCSGSAIALEPETESCDAILLAWYGGESAGQAVADVLFGDYNPSGKLPVTFYRNTEQLPDFENYSMKNRTYRFTTNCLFPFGFGLSYTTFEVGQATVNKTNLSPGESLTLTVPITNCGDRDGATVLQVYVRKTDDPDGPIKTLRGFKRVEVQARASKNVTIELPPTAFEFFDRNQLKLVVAPGEYQVFYGTSSSPVDLKETRIVIQNGT